MKAISLKQPWATWVALGLKSIETRTWKTKHRGPLLICASKTVDKDAVELALEDGFPPYEADAFPTGVAVGTTRVIECRPMTPADTAAALCLPEPGGYAWVLADSKAIRPFPVKGKLSLFRLDVRCPDCKDEHEKVAHPILMKEIPCETCNNLGTKIQPLTDQEVAP